MEQNAKKGYVLDSSYPRFPATWLIWDNYNAVSVRTSMLLKWKLTRYTVLPLIIIIVDSSYTFSKIPGLRSTPLNIYTVS